MELRHLRYFQAVAETLSFSHAAARLHIAQSAVSRQIAALEQEIGVKLFHRTTTRVRLTDAGAHLRKEVDRLLAQLAIALTATQRIACGRGGELNLGSDWRLLFPQIPEAVMRYRSTHPQVAVNLVEIPAHSQLEALHEGRIHLAFVPKEYLTASSGLKSSPLFKAGIKIVVSNRHRLAGARSAALRDLRSETWGRLDEKNSPGYRAIMTQLCHAALFTPRFGRAASSLEGMLALAAMNEVICLLPTSLIPRTYPGLSFLDSDCPPFEFCAVWQKNTPPELSAAFVKVLHQLLAAGNRAPG